MRWHPAQRQSVQLPSERETFALKEDIARSAFPNTSKMSSIQRDESYIVPVRLFSFLQHDQQKESSSCPGWLLDFHRCYHNWCNGMKMRFKGFRKSVSAKKHGSPFLISLPQTTENIYFMADCCQEDARQFWLGVMGSKMMIGVFSSD